MNRNFLSVKIESGAIASVIVISIFFLFMGCKKVDSSVKQNSSGQKPGEFESYLKKKKSPEKNKSKNIRSNHIPVENINETISPPLPDEEGEDIFRSFINGLAQNKIKNCMVAVISKEILLKIKKMNMNNVDDEKIAILKYANRKIHKIRKKILKKMKKAFWNDATYESFSLGKCTWIKKNSEWNNLAFWKCKNSFIYYHLNGDRKAIKIKEIINWGRKWYLTSL